MTFDIFGWQIDVSVSWQTDHRVMFMSSGCDDRNRYTKLSHAFSDNRLELTHMLAQWPNFWARIDFD